MEANLSPSRPKRMAFCFWGWCSDSQGPGPARVQPGYGQGTTRVQCLGENVLLSVHIRKLSHDLQGSCLPNFSQGAHPDHPDVSQSPSMRILRHVLAIITDKQPSLTNEEFNLKLGLPNTAPRGICPAASSLKYVHSRPTTAGIKGLSTPRARHLRPRTNTLASRANESEEPN